MTYYGLSLNVSNLAGSVRANFLLSSTVEMLGYAAAWFLLDRLGRKRLHCGAMILAGAACLASIFSVSFGGTGQDAWRSLLPSYFFFKPFLSFSALSLSVSVSVCLSVCLSVSVSLSLSLSDECVCVYVCVCMRVC